MKPKTTRWTAACLSLRPAPAAAPPAAAPGRRDLYAVFRGAADTGNLNRFRFK